jgi:pyruvate formate lyase activating enzyme
MEKPYGLHLGFMTSGTVFGIVEFAVHDGPGIRTTAFLKGCPLRCSWCHNPEGLSPEPQPMGDRTVGKTWTSSALAARLNDQADILRMNEGGVTFSGGEPLSQTPFVAEVIGQLDRLHVVLDTSGCACEDDFRLVAGRVDLVLFDLKPIDAALHMRFTGRDNAPILRNLRLLDEIGKPFIARVPLVPGVTDTDANLRALAQLLAPMEGLVRVELLPYNRLAGAKYKLLGIPFEPMFDEARPVNADTRPFEEAGLEVKTA